MRLVTALNFLKESKKHGSSESIMAWTHRQKEEGYQEVKEPHGRKQQGSVEEANGVYEETGGQHDPGQHNASRADNDVHPCCARVFGSVDVGRDGELDDIYGGPRAS